MTGRRNLRRVPRCADAAKRAQLNCKPPERAVQHGDGDDPGQLHLAEMELPVGCGLAGAAMRVEVEYFAAGSVVVADAGSRARPAVDW